MTQKIEQQNEEIITLLEKHPEGLSRGKVLESLRFTIHDKTLQRRLTALVVEGRIVRKGERKATRYHPLESSIETIKGQFSQYLQPFDPGKAQIPGYTSACSGKNVL